MSETLAQARCFKHASREAAAKCLECSRFHCRECVTEHEGRVVCRSCLEAMLQIDVKTSSGFLKALIGWSLAGLGILVAAYCFYLVGGLLLDIPSKFHTGLLIE